VQLARDSRASRNLVLGFYNNRTVEIALGDALCDRGELMRKLGNAPGTEPRDDKVVSKPATVGTIGSPSYDQATQLH
jgi:hypothetical protein